MTGRRVKWQVRVTPHDSTDLDAVEQCLASADLRSVPGWDSLMLRVPTKEECEQVARRLRELPLPPVELRVERIGRVRGALHAWFHGGSDTGGPHLGDTPSSWGDGGGGGDGGF